MTVRAVLREDLRYSLTVGLGVLFIAACIVVAVLLALPKHTANDWPPPTTWTSGDGDTVVITPRAAP